MAGAEKKTRSAAAGLRYLSLLAALAPAPASAGAWVAPERQLISTTFYGEEDEEAFYEGTIYFERPVETDTSIVATTWFTGDPAQESGMRGEATLGLKQTVLRGEDWVLAAQGGAVWISEPRLGCDEAGAELRLLAGRSLGERTFLSAEAALRQHGSDCGDNRLELTAGYRPGERWLALGQVFYDSAWEGEEVVRAQVTLVRFFNNGRGIQLGVRSRIDGGAQEAAVVVGLWDRRVD